MPATAFAHAGDRIGTPCVGRTRSRSQNQPGSTAVHAAMQVQGKRPSSMNAKNPRWSDQKPSTSAVRSGPWKNGTRRSAGAAISKTIVVL
jgi:hypothetical protein